LSAENQSIPEHVALIMDGNGRWAKARYLPRISGHRAGLKALRRTVSSCLESRVKVVTVFAFSSENWKRPPEEVSLLMRLFSSALQRDAQELHGHGVRLQVIGDRAQFGDALVDQIEQAEQLTCDNSRLTLVIAANYGGHWDIVQAAKSLSSSVYEGSLGIEEINESRFSQAMSLTDFPAPDLLIRTGGEQRLSNFMLWQMAYTELYFTEVLWPDFDESSWAEALSEYGRRQRRFGQTSEQVSGAT
jgi:undecaprenyl diphosphate synthase